MAYGGCRSPGDSAGITCPDGRRYVGIDGKRYAAHRLAWFYMTGKWPAEIDHRNCDPLDNRFENLREATRSQNNANMRMRADNSSGKKGVSWDRERNSWKAQISVNGVHKLIGRFPSIEAAAAAYGEAAYKHFGEFARL
jgi:hypothetical protein